MQTFLPCGDSSNPYYDSAKVLDRLRLGKQRLETYQIINSVLTKSGWHNHPCSKQWEPYLYSLAEYGIAICNEWLNRGYKDSLLAKLQEYKKVLPHTEYPPWLPKIASSHRAALLAKNYEWYKQFNWKEEPKIDYYWPTKEN